MVRNIWVVPIIRAFALESARGRLEVLGRKAVCIVEKNLPRKAIIAVMSVERMPR